MMQRWSNHLAVSLRTLLRRGVLFLLATVAVLTMSLSPIMSRDANAQGLTDLLSLGGSFTNGLSSCAIESVGWVICPTMRSIAKLADYGFTYVNKNFLKIEYSIASNDSGTYKAWELMRTIANALFVVAFMALIYSQISGRNSGGYNIKRLLPRLVIAAIAVNVSYYLCVALIDVTNIMGDSIMAMFTEIASRVGKTIMPLNATSTAYQDGTLTTITSSVMSKTGTAWVLLAPVAAVIISIATICAAMLILLIMRKTVIAMLILASPILFVAYLLPNLERFFFQSVRLFIQLLLLYPIIALLLGTGQIVSATIVSVGSNDANYRVSGDSYFSRGGGSGSAITDLTASAAAVVPLLGVWFLFKNMSSIMSTAGSRLSATVRGRRGGSEDEKARVTGKATAGAASAKNPAGMNGFGSRRQAFTRNRRRSSLSGSALTDGERTPPRPNTSANALDASIRGRGEGLDKQLEGLQEAQANAQTNGEVNATELEEKKGLGGTVAQAVLGAKGREKDKDQKEVTAKDIFNNMNRAHDSKDKDRKFGAGPGVTGGGGGSAPAGSAQPSAPVASYRAPQMAQTSNIVNGSSAGQVPVQIVAVPVQVSSAELLGSQFHPPENITQAPISGTEEKAKARAQKYLFAAEQDVEDARNRQDILGRKDDKPTEQPHITASTDEKEKK